NYVNLHGSQLVQLIRDLPPSPETTAGDKYARRPLSINDSQPQINTAARNKRVALRNGTMGWTLAGVTCDSGKANRAGDVSQEVRGWAKSAVGRVARRFGIARMDAALLERWRADATRTLYLFDVRDPREYAAGHVAGAVSAPGGQLVQATDQYV